MIRKRVNWERRQLKDLCTSIIDCVNKTAKNVIENTGYKMLRTTNIKKGWIDTENVRFVDEETYKKWTRRQTPIKGDVILTREAPLGEVGMLRTNEKVFLGQRLVSYRANPALLDNRFLLYSFLGSDLQQQVQSLGSGSTVAHMRVPDAEKLTILAPDIDTQREIGSLIGAYDDLIENNQKRLKIIEDIAQSLYTEWFVEFKFPGHEKVKMVDSGTEFGMIPEAWRVDNLTNYIIPQYGFTASAVFNNKLPKFLRGTDINKCTYINWKYVPNCYADNNVINKYRVKKGDIFIIRMADPGKIGICESSIDAIFASYLIRLKIIKEITPYYLFYYLNSEKYQGYIQGNSNGTTRKSINAQQVVNTKILIPSKEILNRFEFKVSQYRELLIKILDINSMLKDTKDYLIRDFF